MAQRLEGPIDYSSRNQVDFNQYADGDNWLLTRGDDYSVKTTSLVGAAKRWGKDNGYAVDVKRYSDEDQGEAVALRFRVNSGGV